MSGAGLRWERMTHGMEFAYSGTICVGSAGTRGMCAWQFDLSGTNGTAVSPAEARAAVEAAWAEWCASAAVVPAGEADGWRPMETAPTDESRVLLWARPRGQDERRVCWAEWWPGMPERRGPGGETWPAVSGCWVEVDTDGTGYEVFDATHWLPLPGPPGAAP